MSNRGIFVGLSTVFLAVFVGIAIGFVAGVGMHEDYIKEKYPCYDSALCCGEE